MSPAAHFPVYDFSDDDVVEAAVNWLWHGLLGRGETTLLTCQWKAGKTTLLAMLIDRMKEGGQLAGLPVTPGHAIVVSEEKKKDWARRDDKYRLRGHCRVLCRPFEGRKPQMAEWLKLMELLDELHRARPADLVVIDTLSSLLPGHAENDSTRMVNALGPLQEIAETGPAILLLHHPRKMPAAFGMAARGTGALTGLVDISMEMTYYRPGAETDRRRRLSVISRHDASLAEQIIEFSEDGTDYAALGDFEFDEFNQRWQELHAVLEPSNVKLTRADIWAKLDDGSLLGKYSNDDWFWFDEPELVVTPDSVRGLLFNKENQHNFARIVALDQGDDPPVLFAWIGRPPWVKNAERFSDAVFAEIFDWQYWLEFKPDDPAYKEITYYGEMNFKTDRCLAVLRQRYEETVTTGFIADGTRYTEYRFIKSPVLRLTVMVAHDRSTNIRVTGRPIEMVKALETELRSVLAESTA